MVTQYNVGDTVLLKGKVRSISVNSEGTKYSIQLPDKSTPVIYEEKNIYDVYVESKNGEQ